MIYLQQWKKQKSNVSNHGRFGAFCGDDVDHAHKKAVKRLTAKLNVSFTAILPLIDLSLIILCIVYICALVFIVFVIVFHIVQSSQLAARSITNDFVTYLLTYFTMHSSAVLLC